MAPRRCVTAQKLLGRKCADEQLVSQNLTRHHLDAALAHLGTNHFGQLERLPTSGRYRNQIKESGGREASVYTSFLERHP
jgi:hypothetical protein